MSDTQIFNDSDVDRAFRAKVVSQAGSAIYGVF